jgi:predicted Rossmann fold flavoprotein
LMAAGQAALAGARVLVLEKMQRPGRKLGITGKGRCNLTNVAPVEEFLEHFGPNGIFLRQAFARFFSDELVEFFRDLGVPSAAERGGRVFPKSEEALDVVDALLMWIQKNGVALKNRSKVERLIIENGKVVGVAAHGQVHQADAVIIATGGASYPGTGSTGDGYQLAAAAGHTIVPIRPALVPLETAGDTAGRLQGLSLININARIYIDGKKQA